MTGPVILCAAEGCENPAGPEGFCLTDHEGLAKAARERAAMTISMLEQSRALQAIRKAARRVVMAERRAIRDRAEAVAKHRKRTAKQSRRRNRR